MAPAWSSRASCDPTPCRGHRPPWPTSWDCAAWPSRSTTCRRLSDWVATEGYGLVGGIGEYEGAWRMAYVRGPEGIIVSLAERIGQRQTRALRGSADALGKRNDLPFRPPD